MGRLLASVAALTLATVGSVATAGAATARGGHRDDAGQGTRVMVKGDGSTVTLSRSTVREGRIAFKVSSSNSAPGRGSQITLLRLVGHTTLAQFKGDLAEEFSHDPAIAAKGTRDLVRDGRYFGLADVSPGNPAIVTERLRAGNYYLMDLGNGGDDPPNPSFTTFRVRPSDRHDDLRDADEGQARSHLPVITMTAADRFSAPRRLPARGTVTVKNHSDTIHFMEIAPVKDGTTDAQIKALFEGVVGTVDPFLQGRPSVGLDVLSPGRQADLTYALQRGTYVLLCFVADDVTGMPHALMGMHKVVTLR